MDWLDAFYHAKWQVTADQAIYWRGGVGEAVGGGGGRKRPGHPTVRPGVPPGLLRDHQRVRLGALAAEPPLPRWPGSGAALGDRPAAGGLRDGGAAGGRRLLLRLPRDRRRLPGAVVGLPCRLM